jgi:saccharopine dehydrogenase-like NADP-dependent oxidoreductase
MKKVVLLGAGKSSIYIIDYLAELSVSKAFELSVADLSEQNLSARCSGKNCTQIVLPNTDFSHIEKLIQDAFLVVSMLPASLHPAVAKLCMKYGSHLVTPSYISDAMQELDNAAKEKELIFLNEMGLDPGIDHMSVMKTLDEWRTKGAKIVGLKSHCGGLVAPQSDTNSWHYKISWNPRNVVLAGAGDGFIQYRKAGDLVQLRYHDLFSHTSIITSNKGIAYESYPNRDSLKYDSLYDLKNATTLYRGTLRVPPFCKAWDVLVKAGCTSIDRPFPILKREEISDIEITRMLDELGFFSVKPSQQMAVDVLQNLIEKVWKMQPTDADRVVMIHEFEIEHNGKQFLLTSSLTLDGKNALYTAMAQTVGLPIAFAVELILENEIKQRGVLLPIDEEIYAPVLAKLEEAGIRFKESVK